MKFKRCVFFMLVFISGAYADDGPPLPSTLPNIQFDPTPQSGDTAPKSEIEKAVAEYMKKQEAKKKEEDEKKKKEAEQKKFDETYGGTCYDLFALYDELNRPQDGAKK